MSTNNQNNLSYNSFLNIPTIPYNIIAYEMTNGSQDFWKMLKYLTKKPLLESDLTLAQKRSLVWTGGSDQDDEQNYNIFLKPLIGNSLDDAVQQSQIRIFRFDTSPEDQYRSVITYEIDIICHEKCSNVYYSGGIAERTDVIESLLLNDLNGKEIPKVGILKFDRELSRYDKSIMNISNSKSFYGRSLMLSIRNLNVDKDGCT